MKPKLLALLFLAGCSTAATSPPGSLAAKADTDTPVYRATLSNGLRVVLCPDDSVPYLAAKLSYRVTYRDDPPGKDGMGYLAWGSISGADKDRWVHKVERFGGWWDPTNFYPEVRAQDVTGPARDLPEMIALFREILEAARPDDPRAEQAFKSTRKWMLSLAEKQVPPLLALLDREGFAEPCAGNSQGSVKSEVESITFEEMMAFRTRHFVPARAQVTLVGAFPPARTLGELERALGALPNPPEAVRGAAELRTFLPGLRCVVEEKGSAPRLLIGYPIPSDVSVPIAFVVAKLMQESLASIPDAGSIRVVPDSRPGQRLLRISVPGGDPSVVLPELEKRLADFPGPVSDDRVRSIARLLERTLIARRLTNFYWMSWPLAFAEFGSDPWQERDRLERLDPAAVLDAAGRILVPQRRLALVVAKTPEEAQALSAAIPALRREKFQADPVPFPVHSPPVQDPPISLGHWNPRVQSLAGGKILFLADPHRAGYSLGGIYPRGILDDRARAYAASLLAHPPEGLDPKKAGFEKNESFLSFDCQEPCWTEQDLLKQVVRIAEWLDRPPAEKASLPPIPALAHENTGELPSWTLMICGPKPVPGLDDVRLPGSPAAREGSVKLSYAPDQLQEPRKAPFQVVVPVGEKLDPAGRAALLGLETWLRAESRARPRYGPFSLSLPALDRYPKKVGRARVGEAAYLTLKFTEGDKAEVMVWLRGGAQIDPLLKPDALENLKGRMLMFLARQYAGAPPDALWAQAHARIWEGGDPAFFDHVEGEIRSLTEDRFRRQALAWLERAVIAGVLPGSPEEEAAAIESGTGYLGVQLAGEVENPERQRLGLKDGEVGVQIQDVGEDGPARKGGLKDGDVIVSFDGKPLADTQDLHQRIGATAPRTEIRLGILRGGRREELSITLGERPD